MDNKELIINTIADFLSDAAIYIILLIIGLLINYIWKSPKLKNIIEKSYKILSYIITFLIIISSLAAIFFWIIFLNDKESILAWIFSIAIGIIIGFCWYLYIKSDKDYEFKDE